MVFTNYGVLRNFKPENCEYIVEVTCLANGDKGSAFDVEDGVKLYMDKDMNTDDYGKIISIEEFNTEYEIHEVLDEYENVVYK